MPWWRRRRQCDWVWGRSLLRAQLLSPSLLLFAGVMVSVCVCGIPGPGDEQRPGCHGLASLPSLGLSGGGRAAAGGAAGGRGGGSGSASALFPPACACVRFEVLEARRSWVGSGLKADTILLSCSPALTLSLSFPWQRVWPSAP